MSDPLWEVTAWTVRAFMFIAFIALVVRHLTAVIRATARALELFIRSLYDRR